MFFTITIDIVAFPVHALAFVRSLAVLLSTFPVAACLSPHFIFVTEYCIVLLYR